MVSFLAPKPDWDFILQVGIAGLAGVAAEKALFGLATYLSHSIAFSTHRELRFELAEKLARVPLGFTDEKSKGEIRNTMVDEIETLEDGMAHLVPEVGAAIIAPLVTLAIMLAIDWRLAILMILPMFVGIWLMGRLLKSAEGPTRDYIYIQSKMATSAAGTTHGRQPHIEKDRTLVLRPQYGLI